MIRFLNIFRILSEVQTGAFVFHKFGAGKSLWVRCFIFGFVYGAISIAAYIIGDSLNILRFPMGTQASPLRPILWAPFRETVFIIIGDFFLRLCFQGVRFPPKVLSILIIISIGLAFGWAHASESLSPSRLWYFMRFGQSGLVFAGMVLQWEAIREERGWVRAFFGVMASHSINNIVVFLFLKAQGA